MEDRRSIGDVTRPWQEDSGDVESEGVMWKVAKNEEIKDGQRSQRRIRTSKKEITFQSSMY